MSEGNKKKKMSKLTSSYSPFGGRGKDHGKSHRKDKGGEVSVVVANARINIVKSRPSMFKCFKCQNFYFAQLNVRML